MNGYKNVLVALELNPESDDVIVKKVHQLMQTTDATFTLVHAIEHSSGYGAVFYSAVAGMDLEEALEKEARKEMRQVAEKLGIPDAHQHIKVGAAKATILAEADQLNVDLILLGSHGHSGVQRLLGSTAGGVLHAAKCDVLVTRLPHSG